VNFDYEKKPSFIRKYFSNVEHIHFLIISVISLGFSFIPVFTNLIGNVNPLKNYNCFIKDDIMGGMIIITVIEVIPFLLTILIEIWVIYIYFKKM
jgi:hypothetical protein